MIRVGKRLFGVFIALTLLSFTGYSQKTKESPLIPHSTPHSATILENFNTNLGLTKLRGKNLLMQLTPKESENGKWGYIDLRKKYVIPPLLTYANEFNDNGLAQVEYNKRWGLMNRNGLFALIPFFSNMTPFDNNGLSMVQCDVQIWSGLKLDKEVTLPYVSKLELVNSDPNYSNEQIYLYLTAKGTWLNSEVYRWAEPFNEAGVARIATREGVGVLKKDGAYLFTPQFTNVGEFKNGYAWFKPQQSDDENSDKYGYLAINGDLALKPIFFSAGDFNNGFAVVSVMDKNNRKYGVLKNDLSYLVPLEYDSIAAFNKDSVALAVKNDIEGYITASGKFLDKNTYANLIKNGGSPSAIPATSAPVLAQNDGTTAPSAVPAISALDQNAQLSSYNGIIVMKDDQGQYRPLFGMDYISRDNRIQHPDSIDMNKLIDIPGVKIGLLSNASTQLMGVCDSGFVMAYTPANDSNYIDEAESTYDNDGIFYRVKLLGKEGYSLVNILNNEVERFPGDSLEVTQEGLIYTFYKKLDPKNICFAVDRKINIIYIAYMAYEQNKEYDEILVLDRYDLRDRKKLSSIYCPIYDIYRSHKNGSIDFHRTSKPIKPSQNTPTFDRLATFQILNVGNLLLVVNVSDQENLMCVLDSKSFSPIVTKVLSANPKDSTGTYMTQSDSTLHKAPKYCASKYGGYYLYAPDGRYVIKYNNMIDPEWQTKISDKGKININNLTENESLMYCVGTSQEAPFVNNDNAIVWEIKKENYTPKMIPLTKRKNSKSHKGFIKGDYLYVQTSHP